MANAALKIFVMLFYAVRVRDYAAHAEALEILQSMMCAFGCVVTCTILLSIRSYNLISLINYLFFEVLRCKGCKNTKTVGFGFEDYAAYMACSFKLYKA